MRAWVVTEAGKPLEDIDLPTPEPTGSEVVLEVTHCGVCHSDLHFWKGEYNMGSGKTMKLSERGVTLPRAPGHEIVGTVVAIGPNATGIALGDVRVIYPWIGCGTCAQCARGFDNLCTAQRSLGVMRDGGFSSQVLVPDPRYLVPIEGLDPGQAATYACSGLTAYSAVSKILPLDPHQPVVLIGAGGVGLMTIAMLRARGHLNIVVVDTSDDKLRAAMVQGATAVIDGNGDGVTERIVSAAGGAVAAVIDFVNISTTARAGFDALAKGGKLVAVGVSGGEITLSLAGLIFKANAIEGTNTGTIQDLRDVIALAQAGKLDATPLQHYPKDQANEALLDLKAGRITGRIILV